jgi:predicted DNA binding protein
MLEVAALPLFEVVLKVTHDCPFANLSRKHPSMKMFTWCNREHEVHEIIAAGQEENKLVMHELSETAKVLEIFSNQCNAHVVTTPCYCNTDNSVTRNIDSFNLLHVPPVVYEKGWEYYRLIVFRHEDLRRLMQRLEEKGFTFEVVRKVPFNGFIASSLTLTADALFAGLTDKQMEALLTAYNSGYYRLPRRADVQTIAYRRHLSRTTFQEHLKKAENKLVASLVPYIQLFRKAPPDKRKALELKHIS